MATDPVTGTKQSWSDQVATLSDEATKGYTLNERIVMAMDLLSNMNMSRSDAQAEWGKKVIAEGDERKKKGKTFDKLEQMAMYARLMKEHFAAGNWTKKDKIWQTTAKRLETAATNAETFWNQAIKDYERMTKLLGVRPEDLVVDAAATKFAGGLTRTSELDDLEKVLAKAADKLFADPAGPPPKSADYNAAIETFKNDLTALHNRVVAALIVKVAAKPGDVPSATFGWIVAWVRAMQAFLAKQPFNLAADLKDKAYVPNTATGGSGVVVGQAEDLRRAHRFGLALAVLKAALFAGFDGVRKTAAAMIIGDSISRIVVLDDWKPGNEPGAKMVEDFPGNRGAAPIDEWVSSSEVAAAAAAGRDPVPVPAPFTLEELINFFNLTYLQTLTAGLEAVLDDAYKSPITSKTKYDLKPVSEKAAKLPRPRRWAPTKWLYLLSEKDPTSVARLLNSSGKTILQVPKDPLGARLYPRMKAWPMAPCFIWVIPDLSPLVTFLKKNAPGLDLLIAADTGTDAPTSPDDWIYELGRLYAKGRFTKMMIWSAIKRALSTEFDAEQKRLLRFSREIAALDRQIVKAKAVDLLDAFKNRSRGGTTSANFGPDKVLRMIWDYRARVQPWTDAETQTAALILDLAQKLDDDFPDAEDVPGYYFPLLVLGIKAADEQAAGRKPAKSALEARVLIEDVVGRSETVSSLTAGKPYLEALKKRMENYLKGVQDKQGFYGSGNKLGSFRYASTFTKKDEFSWDSRTYRLVKIHKPFAYHPPVGVGGSVGSVLKESNDKDAKDIPRDQAIPLFTIDIDDSAAPLGLPTPQVWALSGPSAEGIPEERAARRKLPALAATATDEEKEQRTAQEEKIKEETETEQQTGRYIVTSADDKLLSLIAFAVELATMNEDLQVTGQVIGGFMEVIVTAAELILPGGQVIMWAEMAAGVAQTLTDPEMIELIDTIKEDPSRIIDLIVERFKSLASPEGLWDILMEDGLGLLDRLSAFASIFDDARKKRSRTPKTSNRAKPRGRLGRIVMFFINLGKRILRAFHKLKMFIKKPLSAIRSAIITRPRLAWILNKAVELLIKIERYAPLLTLGASMASDVFSAAMDAKGHVIEFAQSVTEMELPGELVPLDVLYTPLVSFILGKIPKVKLIRPILDAVGWTQKLTGLIIGAIGVEDSWADPNKYWREFLIPFIEPHFLWLKREFVHSVLGMVKSVGDWIAKETGLPFSFDLPSDGELGDNKPKLVTAEELEEFPSDEPGLPASVGIPHDSGHPLGGSALTQAQASFGQDFSHVRVHDDAASSLFTATLGAEAATSGSHVFLGEHASSGGGEILHHELAHVVQQTGSRPLGGDHGSTPMRGASGPGVTFDPGREAAADRMAAGAAPTITTPPSLSIGVQPRFTDDLLKKVVGTLTRFRPGGGQFIAAAASPSDVPGGDIAVKMFGQLKKDLSTKTAKWEKFLSDETVVKPALIDRISLPSNGDIAGVAALAQKNTGKKDQYDEPITELNGPRFVTLLEGFLYARTGVAMQIDAPYKSGAFTIKGISINYLHLPFVPYQGKGQALWDRVMKTPGLVVSGEDTTKIRHLVRARLDAVAPDPFIWHTSKVEFEFSTGFVKEFRRLLQESRSRGRPTAVEVAKSYAETELSKNKQQSGLRVATHGELTKSGHPERSDRESHHLPQFLLVEFFRNRNANTRAWPAKKTSAAAAGYAKQIGLKGTPLVDSVAPDGHLFRLKDPLDKNESERGVGLPAVLLAAETHRKGPLHVDDYQDENDDKTTQSLLIKGEWWSNLPKALRNDDPEAWTKHLSTTPSDAKKIASAMVATYRWMYKDIMLPGLKTSLNDIEKPYYEGLAAELGHTDSKDNLLDAYKLDTNLINKVVKAVETKNDAVMTDWK